MLKKINKKENRIKRHKRLRNHISGTAMKPRLSVYRSSKHIYAQLIDDEAGNTLVSASTLDKSLDLENTGNIEAAKAVGTAIANKAKEKVSKKLFLIEVVMYITAKSKHLLTQLEKPD